MQAAAFSILPASASRRRHPCQQRYTRWILLYICCVTSLFGSSPARAAEPQGSAHVRVDVLGGYALTLGDGHTASGPGLGVRTGYNFDSGLFLGASVSYYPGLGQQDTEATSLLLELGYSFALGSGSLRPYLGLGPTFVRPSDTQLCEVDGQCVSTRHPVETFANAALGAVYVHPLGGDFHIGADARFTSMPHPEYARHTDEMGYRSSSFEPGLTASAYALFGARF